MSLFFAQHVFGPGRAALPAAQLPATHAAATADRNAQAAAIQTRLKQIDTAQNSCILELEPDPPRSFPAGRTMGRSGTTGTTARRESGLPGPEPVGAA